MGLLLIIAVLCGSPISIILILFAIAESDRAEEFDYAESQRERRHKELMEIERKRILEERNIRSGNHKRRIRTAFRDEKGRYIVQEVYEGYDDEEC